MLATELFTVSNAFSRSIKIPQAICHHLVLSEYLANGAQKNVFI